MLNALDTTFGECHNPPSCRLPRRLHNSLCNTIRKHDQNTRSAQLWMQILKTFWHFWRDSFNFISNKHSVKRCVNCFIINTTSKRFDLLVAQIVFNLHLVSSVFLRWQHLMSFTYPSRSSFARRQWHRPLFITSCFHHIDDILIMLSSPRRWLYLPMMSRAAAGPIHWLRHVAFQYKQNFRPHPQREQLDPDSTNYVHGKLKNEIFKNRGFCCPLNHCWCMGLPRKYRTGVRQV